MHVMNEGVAVLCIVVILASLVAIVTGAETKKLRVVACGFYASAVMFAALAVEYQARGDGHPGLWVGAAGCLLVALGIHARAMGRDL